jgi:ribosomal protein L32
MKQKITKILRAICSLVKCPACGYHAWNGEECFDCGYRG